VADLWGLGFEIPRRDGGGDDFFQNGPAIHRLEILLHIAVADGAPGVAAAEDLHADAAAGVEVEAAGGQSVKAIVHCRAETQCPTRPHKAAVVSAVAFAAARNPPTAANLIVVASGDGGVRRKRPDDVLVTAADGRIIGQRRNVEEKAAIDPV